MRSAVCIFLTMLFCESDLIRLAGQSPQTYDSLIVKTDALTREGKFVEATADALEATRSNHDRFEGYYYAAFSLYKRGMIDDARPLASEALSRAPEAQRSTVQKLVDAIANNGKVEGLTREADSTYKDGFVAKAARQYAEAWNTLPSREDVGIKAAKLLFSTNQTTDAVRILRRIGADNEPSDYRKQARELLSEYAFDIGKLYQSTITSGRKDLQQHKLDSACSDFNAAIELLPNAPEGHFSLSSCLAAQPAVDIKAVSSEVGRAANAGAGIKDFVYSLNFKPLLTETWFRTLLADIYGPSALDGVKEASDFYVELEAAEKTKEWAPRTKKLSALLQQVWGYPELREYVQEIIRKSNEQPVQ